MYVLHAIRTIDVHNSDFQLKLVGRIILANNHKFGPRQSQIKIIGTKLVVVQ